MNIVPDILNMRTLTSGVYYSSPEGQSKDETVGLYRHIRYARNIGGCIAYRLVGDNACLIEAELHNFVCAKWLVSQLSILILIGVQEVGCIHDRDEKDDSCYGAIRMTQFDLNACHSSSPP